MRASVLATSVAALMLAPAQTAFAARFTPDKTPLSSTVTDGSGGASAIGASGGAGEIARMVVGLAIVLGVVYGLYWLLKSATRTRGSDAGGRIEVVATTPLAANHSLHLLRCGDELILVGTAEHAVTPLRVYSPDEAAAFGLLDPAAPAVQTLPAAPAPAQIEAPRPRGPMATVRGWTVRA